MAVCGRGVVRSVCSCEAAASRATWPSTRWAGGRLGARRVCPAGQPDCRKVINLLYFRQGMCRKKCEPHFEKIKWLMHHHHHHPFIDNSTSSSLIATIALPLLRHEHRETPGQPGQLVVDLREEVVGRTAGRSGEDVEARAEHGKGRRAWKRARIQQPLLHLLPRSAISR